MGCQLIRCARRCRLTCRTAALRALRTFVLCRQIVRRPTTRRSPPCDDLPPRSTRLPSITPSPTTPWPTLSADAALTSSLERLDGSRIRSEAATASPLRPGRPDGDGHRIRAIRADLIALANTRMVVVRFSPGMPRRGIRRDESASGGDAVRFPRRAANSRCVHVTARMLGKRPTPWRHFRCWTDGGGHETPTGLRSHRTPTGAVTVRSFRHGRIGVAGPA